MAFDNIYNLFDVTDRVVVVTGGAQGLGRMIAEAFVRAGAEVCITSRRPEMAEAAAAEMRAFGRCTGIGADLSTPEATRAFAAELCARHERIHVLINNAGKTWGAPLESFPDKAWPGVLAVNVQMPFTLVRELLGPLMAAAGPADPARVLNIGSIAGSVVEPIEAYSYAASKAALHHLGRVMAAELGPRGIAVNTVIPGYFPTRMTDHIRADPGAEAGMNARVPLGRMGTPEDIAGLCLFLSSRAGGYLNGAELVLDGGLAGCR